MKAAVWIIIVVIVLSLIGWFAYDGVQQTYLQPRAELHEEIVAFRGRITKMDSALAGESQLHARLQKFIDRTLADGLEAVDHALRLQLNALAESAGLASIAVGTGTVTPRGSPAKQLFASDPTLRDEVDFVEVEGWVTAQGTLSQIVRFVQALDGHAWLHHITQLQLRPNAAGSLLSMSLRMITVFMPGRAPSAALLANNAASSVTARYAALLEASPFRWIAPVNQSAASQSHTPTAPNYAAWSLTGIATGRNGTEAWMLNRQTGETRLLTHGDSLHEAVLVDIDSESAAFEVAGMKRWIAVGEDLPADWLSQDDAQ